MARHLPLDHFCPWREEAEELRQRQVALEAKVASLEKRVFGRSSERLPGVQQQLRREQAGGDRETRRRQALDKRRRRAARRAEAPTGEIHHPVPEAERTCPACGGDELKPLGLGRTTVVYEYIPARIEKQVHVQQTLACACGKGVVMAPAPPKVVDRGEYGPGFIAHVVASKCADSMPLHRLARRLGGHSSPEMEKGEWLIGYRFSMGRAGKTPKDVLGGTTGSLVVDAYTGYNMETVPKGRVRVGCWAHVRRKFFDALSKTPEAQEALDSRRSRPAWCVRSPTAPCVSRRAVPCWRNCTPAQGAHGEGYRLRPQSLGSPLPLRG